jgi:hypothetical protein
MAPLALGDATENGILVIFRTEIDRLKKRGFIDAERLNFVGVFPYTLYGRRRQPIGYASEPPN